jgi:rubrerythrin
MLSKISVKVEKIAEENLDKQVLRAAIIAELDAVNLYEQMASLTGNSYIRTILLDEDKEEKTHVGEFQTLFLKLDEQQKEAL